VSFLFDLKIIIRHKRDYFNIFVLHMRSWIYKKTAQGSSPAQIQKSNDQTLTPPIRTHLLAERPGGFLH